MSRVSDRFIRPLPPEDFATAQSLRELSKTAFEFLKNLILLGALKYVADKTRYPIIEVAYWFGCGFFLMFCTSYLQPWRLRVLSALWRNNNFAYGCDVVLNMIALLAFQIWLFFYLQKIVEQLAAAQGH